MIFLKILKKELDTFFPKRVEFENVTYKLVYKKDKKLFYFLNYRDEQVKKMFWQLKFHKNREPAFLFAGFLYENIFDILEQLKLEENFNYPVLTFVPSHFFRKVKRTYDQNEVVLKYFKKMGGENFVEVEKTLKKVKHTKPQNRMLNKKEREENVKGIFKVLDVESVKGRNVVLLDDIYTTGSTLKEAEKVLKKAKVRKVFFITIAH